MQGTKQVHEHDVYIGNNVRSSGPAPTNSWDLTSFAQNYFVIGAFFGALAVLGSYWLLWRPLNRIRDLSDVGFRHLRDESRRRGISLKSLVNEVRARKRIGQVPPIYPNGWFALVESRDLARGSVKSVSAIGHNFAVFRDHNGDAFVLDAYCPHLGADLSVGGKVKGSCIECPFHGWRFNGHNGECVHIPYSEKVPSVAKVKKWTSLEQTGWIFIWFHAEGEEPSWTPPRVEEIHDGRWVYRGRTEHFINSHIQDVPENGGDIAHLNQVHSPSLLAGVDLRYMYDRIWEFAQHHWIASWKEGEAPDSHTAGLNLTHTMKIFGKITVFNMNVHAKQIGPAMTHLEMDLTFGRGVIVQTVTPIGPLELRFVHQFYADKSIPPPYCKIIMFGEAIMVERDIMIWNSKTYTSRPLLVKEDRLLARHRRWFSQFYSENSPKLTFMKDSYDW